MLKKNTIFLFLSLIAHAHCVFLGVCYKKPSACVLKTNLALNLETEQNIISARCKALQALNDTEKFYNVEVWNGLEKCEGKIWENVKKIEDELKKIEEDCKNEKEDKEIETNSKLVTTDEAKKEEAKNDMELKKIETPKKERIKGQARQHYAWIVATPQNEIKKEDWRTEEQKKELAERKAKSPSKQFYAWVIRDEPKKQDKEKDMELTTSKTPVDIQTSTQELETCELLKSKLLSEIEFQKNQIITRCKVLKLYDDRTQKFYDWTKAIDPTKCEQKYWGKVEEMKKELKKLDKECDKEERKTSEQTTRAESVAREVKNLEEEWELKRKRIPVCVEATNMNLQIKEKHTKELKKCEIEQALRFRPNPFANYICKSRAQKAAEPISDALETATIECDIALGNS